MEMRGPHGGKISVDISLDGLRERESQAKL